MIKKIITSVGNTFKHLFHFGEENVPSTAPQNQQAKSAAMESPAINLEVARENRNKGRKNVPSSRRRQSVKKSKPWELSNFKVAQMENKLRFHDLDLPLEIMHAIADLEFKYCTPIQEKVLSKSLMNKDIIGRAQTGTGKTAAFLVSIIPKLLTEETNENRKKSAPKALIIAPTRELVMQIAHDAQDLTKYTPIKTVAVFGGVDYDKQLREIENKVVDVIVATPGRLLDYLQKKVLYLDQVQVLVLDEADRMLDMGFIPDVKRIVYKTPPREKRQTLLFSATISEDVRYLASQWCVDPVTIEIEPEQVTVDTVDQMVYLTTSAERYTILYNVLTQQHLDRVLIFTNRRDEARELTERLKSSRINCAMLSGEVPQQQRMKRLENFRSGDIKVLVATDVAGRGIHIDGVTHVINYMLPYEPEDYVHRIGRTGRAGTKGVSISFACEESAFYLPDIEAYIGRKLSCVHPDESLLVPPPKSSRPPAQKSRSKNPPRRRSGGANTSHRESARKPRPHASNSTKPTSHKSDKVSSAV